MKYESIWKKVLNGNETVEHEFSIGNGYVRTRMIAWGLLAVAVYVLGNWVFSQWWFFDRGFFLTISAGILAWGAIFSWFYAKKSHAYAFTNKRMIVHRGMFTTKTVTVDYNRITDVYVREGWLQKYISGTGTLAVSNSGDNEIVLKHVDKPYELKKILDQLSEKRNQTASI
jgi:membrane protein YdbS with pleckstrin-like domain